MNIFEPDHWWDYLWLIPMILIMLCCELLSDAFLLIRNRIKK